MSIVSPVVDLVADAVADPTRLAALRETGLLDTPVEASFDRLTRLASALLGAPVAFMALVDEHRQFFKSAIGLPEPLAQAREMPLSYSLCKHVVASHAPLIISDTRQDARVRDNPAIQAIGLIAYAGVPLTTADGQTIGSFCVVESTPREWTTKEIGILTDLATSVMTEIQLRQALRAAEAQAENAERARGERDEVLERVPDAVVTLDTAWRVTSINKKAETVLQRSRQEVVGGNIWEMFPSFAGSLYESECRRALREGVPARFDAYFDGIGRWFDVHADPRPGEHLTDGGLAVYVRDITQRKTAEALAHNREARLQLFLRQLPAVLWTTDSDLKFTSMLGAGLDALGLAPDQLIGKPLADLFGGDDPTKAVLVGHSRALAGHSVTFDAMWQGRTYTNQIEPLRDPKGVITGTLGLALDITDRKNLEEQLAYHAFHDPLTGLANRNVFHDRAERALARVRRGEHVAVLFIDLDDFKTVNDSLGHGHGDLLLVAVAARLQRATRGCDTVARLGGDEFAVLLEGMVSPSDSDVVVDRIMTSLRTPVMIDGREVLVSGSIGIAHARAEDSADSLLRNADVAMYRAKGTQKGTVAVFESAMHTAVVERLELGADLRRALERGELHLMYQPIVDLTSGGMSGVEALVRWQHPTRGAIPPLTFVPIAEESGVIVAIGRWVLEQTCQQLVTWDAERLVRGEDASPPWSVSVNLSGRQLVDPDFVGDVRQILETTGLSPDRVLLEITESVVLRRSEDMIATLWALKGLGVRLAVDDFGTGYSSLGYLQQFPIDVLKIDKSFVDGVAKGGSDAALANTIVALGDALRLRLVAEGVEQVEQQTQLRALGCDSAQGYLFARPLAAGDILSWSASHGSDGAVANQQR